MENRYDNVKKEIQIYIACFIFSGFINVMFWLNLPEMISNIQPGDEIFIFLACFAAAGSIIGLTIHFIMYLRNTRDIRKK